MIDIPRSTLGHFVILPTLLIANIDSQVTSSALLHEYLKAGLPPPDDNFSLIIMNKSPHANERKQSRNI